MADSDSLGKMSLGINIRKDFTDSAAFMEKLGHFISRGEFFLPGAGGFKKGDSVAIHFTLDGGRRDIIRGTAEILGIHGGGGGLPKGIHLAWLEMDERTAKNLDMVEAWQQQNKLSD